MYISIHGISRLHWWGQDIIFISPDGDIYKFTQEETFFIKYLTKTMEINKLELEISNDLQVEINIIRTFIDLFLTNYKILFCKTNIYQNSINITGQEGLFYPFLLHVSLTNSCHQFCKHCYKGTPKNKIDIDFNDLVNFLNCVRGKIPFLNFSGGEPTLYPKFSELMNIFNEDFDICVSTSGYKIADTIVDSFKLARRGIQVSLYSANKNTHNDFVQKNDSFDNIITLIKKAINKNIMVGVTTILTNKNYEDIIELVRFCSKINVPFINIGLISPLGRAKLNKLGNSVITREFLANKVMEIKNIFAKEIHVIDSINCHSKLNLSSFRCIAGTLNWSIVESGDIQPCGVFSSPELSIGSINNFCTKNFENPNLYLSKFEKSEILKQLKSTNNNCPFEY